MISVYFDKNLIDKNIKSENFWLFDDEENITYRKYFLNKKEIFLNSSLQDCEYVFLPYKWDNNMNKISHLFQNNKKVVAFYNDDDAGTPAPSNDNFVLFRTSAYKTKLKKNEKIYPAFCEEINFEPVKDEIKNHRLISFCGQVESNRAQIFQEIYNNNRLRTNFIIRNGFWAPEIQDKKIARQQFFKNMIQSLFVICVRGAGNFSYRLYETLAAGRIPIIVNTDLKLPLENFIEWDEHAIIIEKKQIQFLHILIEQFLYEKNIDELCLANKQLWDNFFSPYGFIKNFRTHISND